MGSSLVGMRGAAVLEAAAYALHPGLGSSRFRWVGFSWLCEGVRRGLVGSDMSWSRYSDGHMNEHRMLVVHNPAN